MAKPRPLPPAPDNASRRWVPGRAMGLSRALMKAGYGTRRWADQAVREGRVRVGRDVVKDPLRMLVPDAEVYLDDKPLVKVAPLYYAFHKPVRVVCREQDGPGRRRVEDFYPAGAIGLRPVGRLDARTSGLLLLSNDGVWITGVTGRSTWEYEYQVQVDGDVSDMQLTVIDAGIVVPGLGLFRPTAVSVLNRDGGRTMLAVSLQGGQARQMRRMLSTLRHKVLMVRLVRLGGVRLGDLAAGRLRPLTTEEIASFQDVKAIDPAHPRENRPATASALSTAGGGGGLRKKPVRRR